MTSQLWILLGSLLVILAVTALVRFLRMGEVALQGRDDAIHWADINIPFFHGSDALVAEDGQAALVSDAEGQVVLVKRHGAKFAARLIDHSVKAERIGPGGGGGEWRIDSGDKHFGAVSLRLDHAGAQKLLTMV
ncbi:MAG: hypothetical protein AAGH53_04860 [Pseudomonadota bacterium]